MERVTGLLSARGEAPVCLRSLAGPRTTERLAKDLERVSGSPEVALLSGLVVSTIGNLDCPGLDDATREGD